MASNTEPKAETACCPPTRVPALVGPSEHEAQGAFEEIAEGLRAYVVKPKSGETSKRAVILLNDIFGIATGRHVGVADTIAEGLGCTVVGPDFFRDDKLGHDQVGTPAMMEFIKRHPLKDLQADLDKVYAWLKPEEVDSIGLLGFCYGAWMVFQESTRLADPRIKAGANFHPSLGIEQVHGGSPETLAAGIKLPQLVCPSKDDPELVRPGGPIPADKATYEIFDLVNHGFMTQGDVKDETVHKCVEAGIKLCTEYFRGQLKA
ncbi:Carboxymethylenebutenolidase-like [Hondaea fermentalgiana]|uniref:Carboxymethylenebutenolidase-like n=1 Tax=Hondaea fermentalgiana TaxID=2315210 RepID=A0A2R5GTX0_9STRA|nr:Carboxymethylenebutenolidase-like [Hondaea fermentalgiana]|eukprot:GBG34015.1 Carboxymethylenebutenolidase-like [Hondaea fermentalgiana]